jgi:hypothetical protein
MGAIGGTLTLCGGLATEDLDAELSTGTVICQGLAGSFPEYQSSNAGCRQGLEHLAARDGLG